MSENFNDNSIILTEAFGDVNLFPIDPIWPDGTRRSEPGSFVSPSPLPDQVPIQSFAHDNMFPGQIQEAIAPQMGPPLPGQPLAAEPADAIVGASFVVNQEAVNFTTDGNNASADGTPWHLRSDVNSDADANITNVWDQDVLGRNVVIGIIDNGFEINDTDKELSGHPDLLSNYREDLSYDFDEGDAYPSRLLNSTIAYSGDSRTIRNSKIVGSSFIMDVPLSGGVVKELKLNLEIEHEAKNSLDVFLLAPKEYPGQPDKKRPQAKVLKKVGEGEYSLDLTKKFQDINAGGSWKLKIKDKNTKDGKSGTLKNWSLELETVNSHGTAVAGVAAASGDNGISGVAPEAEWAGLRMGADGTDDDEITRALSHKNDEIDIYNNSWGTGFFQVFPAAELALAEAVNNGRGGLGNIYVFSGGNAQQDDLGHPHSNVNYNSLANSRHTIAVGAIDHEGKQALYSEPGAPLLVSAYSSSGREGDRGISTTGPYSDDGNDENDYNHAFGGTSASAPFVSGVIALMLEANQNLTSRDVQHILVKTAQKNDPDDDDWSENGARYHVNHKYGFGAIDAEAAVELAEDWTSVGEEISVSQGQDTNLPIPNYNPDNPLISTITINDDMTVEWVEVEFDATHNYLGQLEIVLISPDGTESVLAEKHGNGLYTGDDDSYEWTFTSARHWGESPVGEWTLLVWDRDERIPSDDNFWNSWELNIYGTQPTVSISATDANASEAGDAGEFTVTRTGDTTKSLSVGYSTAGDADAGTDYSNIGEILFPAGSSEVTVSLDPIDDEEIEGDETVVLNLEAGTGYLLGDESSAEVRITDNDSLADLRIINISNLTTVAPRGTLTYTLFVVNSGSQAATDIEISDTLPVDFSLLSVTPGGNFVADTSTPGIVSFTGGSLASGESAILTISGNVSPDAVGSITNSVVVDPDNKIAESDETNNTATATTTIKAIAPLPIVTISATDANASEDGDTGKFTVTRTGDTTESLSVGYSTAGNASAGRDYSNIGNNIIIPARSSRVTVTINPIDDEKIEGDETVVLNLRAGTGYMLGGQSSAQVRITDSPIAGVIHTASYNGHTYHLLETDGTKWWLDAEAEANRLGGHLVTINNAAENKWVFDTFAPFAVTYANDNNLPDREKISLWIGLSDHRNEGRYQWSSGQSNRYLNWVSGQPENGADDEDFAGMLVNFGYLSDRGKWHDISGEPRDIDLPFAVVEI